MKTLNLIGPVSFSDLGKMDRDINGIYLWCVKDHSSDLHRVHYIGESVNVAHRLLAHRRNQLAGAYTGFCQDGLRRNVKILKHRAGKGMIAKYSVEDRQAFNAAFLDTFDIFYAKLEPTADRNLRRRYEYAIYMAVEDCGQNILAVGYLTAPVGEPFEVLIAASASRIEALTGEVIRV